ncbi:MAG: hypothetical protein ACYTDU_18170 [Planctomycetota bacterium]
MLLLAGLTVAQAPEQDAEPADVVRVLVLDAGSGRPLAGALVTHLDMETFWEELSTLPDGAGLRPPGPLDTRLLRYGARQVRRSGVTPIASPLSQPMA